MAEISLPSNTQLHQSVPSLPKDIQRITNRLYPSNGSSFVAGQSIQFDLSNSGNLVPESMNLIFEYAVTTTGNATGETNTYIAGTPCYSAFNRLDVQANGAMLSSISQYHEVAHMLCKTRMSLAQRASVANQFAISNYSVANTTDEVANATLNNLNGYCLPAGATTTVIKCTQPVISILSLADKTLPLFAGSAMRMTFWLAPQSEYVVLGTGQTAVVTVRNVSLVYDVVHLGQQYEEMVRAMGPQFARTTHYGVVSQNLAAAAGASNIDLVFQSRFSSIRACYLLPNYAGRSVFDFNSVTGTSEAGSGGRLNFSIDGVQYPQAGIDLNNIAGVYHELRTACHSTGHSSDSFAMSIPFVEWYFTSTVTPTGGITRNPVRPGSFIVGTSLEKFTSGAGNFLVNGTSSQSAPILARYTTNGETLAYSVSLVCAVDAIMSFDPQARTITVDV